MFETEQFINDCRNSLKETDAKAAINEILARAVSEPGQVMHVFGEPRRAGVDVLYHAEDLTILHLVWGPGMEVYPHNHRMWAAIGIYTGTEDNTFYQRSADGLTRHGMKQLNVKDTAALGETVIHSVSNPLSQCTAALHVYGGDFFAAPRSEWDMETFTEKPFDFENAKRLFELSNREIERQQAAL